MRNIFLFVNEAIPTLYKVLNWLWTIRILLPVSLEIKGYLRRGTPLLMASEEPDSWMGADSSEQKFQPHLPTQTVGKVLIHLVRGGLVVRWLPIVPSDMRGISDALVGNVHSTITPCNGRVSWHYPKTYLRSSWDNMVTWFEIINPRHAHAARVVVLGVYVCVSVYGHSGTTGYRAAYEQYQWLQNNERVKKKKVIFLKQLH